MAQTTYAAFSCLILTIATAFVCTAGCSSGMERIDSDVDRLLTDSSTEMGGEVVPTVSRLHTERSPWTFNRDVTDTKLPTRNPAADELNYTPRDEASDILARLDSTVGDDGDALQMNLAQAWIYATRHSREYRFAEEEYILAAMRLLIERHLWGPRFFNDTSLTVDSIGDEGFFDTSMQIVNEFTVTQRLPYGGQIAATALARASEDLHRRVAYSANQSADLILSADIPLLRGAGNVARESRIQSERNLVYQARQFEQFRRQFLVDIAIEFLNLVVRQQAIANAERQVESLRWLVERSEAFVESGRETPIDLALAQRSELFALDTLNQQQENYRLALERFKVRIGVPLDQHLVIVRSDPGLSVPEVTLDEAVQIALTYRLDLQTERDRLEDARRNVDNARNALLPELNISGLARVSTDESKRRAGLDFQPQNSQLQASVTFGLPLDREIERINVRQSQINLERAIRDYNRFRDQLAVETRGAVRAIDQAVFSARIQQQNVFIAERAEAAIRADPDRATPRDRTEAVDALLRARDELDAANRDVQVAILEYLELSGQLRVQPDGSLQPLQGMEIAENAPVLEQPAPGPEPAGG